MNQVNNFEVTNIDVEAMNQIVEIKDEELKQITGGNPSSIKACEEWERCDLK